MKRLFQKLPARQEEDSKAELSSPFLLHNLHLSKSFSSQWEVYAGIKNMFDYIQPYTPLTGYNDPKAAAGFSDYFDTVYSYALCMGGKFTWASVGNSHENRALVLSGVKGSRFLF